MDKEAFMTRSATHDVRFWDRIAERYATQPVKDPDAYEKTLARTRTYLAPGDTVLEIGGGTGSTGLKLAGSVARYISSDVSPAMTGIARNKIADSGLQNVEALAADIFDRQFEAEEFDALIAFNLLHLVRDRQGVLARAHDLIKPGGYFISKTPALGEFGLWVRPLIALMQLVGKAPGVWFFTRAELDAEIEAAGFRIIETGDYPARPPSHLIIAQRL